MTNGVKGLTDKTSLVHAGRSATRFNGAVNPPIKRASTILAKHPDELYAGPKSLYGRLGTEVHDVLIDGLKALETAEFVQLSANGLSACSMAMASCVTAGDHFLLTDAAYGPTRRFVQRHLKKMGVSHTIFDPRISASELEALIRPETKAVFFESPGSLTFELSDIEALLPVCRAHELVTIADNTWGAGICYHPLKLGFDLSVQALTKYVIGHSDGFGGMVATNRSDLARKLKETAEDWGMTISPDDAYLAQRGLRTLHNRIKAQGKSSVELATWLEAHPQVQQVMHPALPSHPDHHIWKRDFDGTAGLFGFCLKETDQTKIYEALTSLDLFGFGFSWGGFESLILPCEPQLKRTQSPKWKQPHGYLLRINTGLESTEDLIGDLDRFLANL
ncbi:MAG: cystathionine beta-lyase [Ponticaulis sp.]|nr:cystathionine beta-lyase [Ponticaulis sp.]